jgi:hypothetical protein
VCKFVTPTEILLVKSETFLNGSELSDLAELPVIEERLARFLARRLRTLFMQEKHMGGLSWLEPYTKRKISSYPG